MLCCAVLWLCAIQACTEHQTFCLHIPNILHLKIIINRKRFTFAHTFYQLNIVWIFSLHAHETISPNTHTHTHTHEYSKMKIQDMDSNEIEKKNQQNRVSKASERKPLNTMYSTNGKRFSEQMNKQSAEREQWGERESCQEWTKMKLFIPFIRFRCMYRVGYTQFNRFRLI